MLNVRVIACALALSSQAPAHKVSLTAVAAGSTVLVNALEIRTTTAKALKAIRACRHAVVKTAKKVVGK